MNNTIFLKNKNGTKFLELDTPINFKSRKELDNYIKEYCNDEFVNYKSFQNVFIQELNYDFIIILEKVYPDEFFVLYSDNKKLLKTGIFLDIINENDFYEKCYKYLNQKYIMPCVMVLEDD